MLPPLASVQALSYRLSAPLTSADAPRARAALDDASAKVRAEAGKSWVLISGYPYRGEWLQARSYRPNEAVYYAGAFYFRLREFLYDRHLSNRFLDSLTPADSGSGWQAIDPAPAPTDFVLDPMVPDIIPTVVLGAAVRAISNPEQIVAEDIGNTRTQWANSGPDVYLTKQEIRLVRRAAGFSGLWAQNVSRADHVETFVWPWDDILVPEAFTDGSPAGDPFLSSDF